jgi:hypothetical protein
VGYFRDDLVSGGAEVLTEEYWDGEPIYRRCYEIASDITSSTTIAAIASGLEPIDAPELTANKWYITPALTETGTGAGIAGVRYDSSTGSRWE